MRDVWDEGLLLVFRGLCHAVPMMPGRLLRYAGFRLFTNEMYCKHAVRTAVSSTPLVST
jgi:hypothetical protein